MGIEDPILFDNLVLDNKNHLYKHLFINIPEEKYREYNVISYNYDRSFEFYFSRALARDNDCSLEEAFQRFEELKMVHIHGRLPALPGENGDLLPLEREKAFYGKYKEVTDINLLGHFGLPPFEPGGGIVKYPEQFRGSVRKYGLQFETVYQNSGVNEKAQSMILESDRVILLVLVIMN